MTFPNICPTVNSSVPTCETFAVPVHPGFVREWRQFLKWAKNIHVHISCVHFIFSRILIMLVVVVVTAVVSSRSSGSSRWYLIEVVVVAVLVVLSLVVVVVV